jgi:tetratricopeptide (TPR) repeat protein
MDWVCLWCGRPRAATVGTPIACLWRVAPASSSRWPDLDLPLNRCRQFAYLFGLKATGRCGIWENRHWHCEAEVILSEASDELMGQAAQLRRQNRAAEAIAAYRAIVARWPKLADAWYNLAVLQRQSFRFDEALASYQQSLASGVARPEEVHLNRSVIFSDFLRDHARAAAELQQALTLNPAYTPALLNLANLYEDFGRRAEASSLYARILTLEPQAFEALARFANLQPAGSVDASLVKALRDALTAAPSMSDRASLGFALGRLLDAAGDYRDAFLAYAAANQASLASAGPIWSPMTALGSRRLSTA